MTDYAEQLRRFMALFRGSSRSFGRYFPGNGKVLTEKAAVQDTHFIEHLRGEVGVGVVPIQDDNTCWFATIDIDCHGEDQPEIDLPQLEARRTEQGLPLTICRSKSGGAHCILFGLEPMQCTSAVQLLTRWAASLGYPGSEIFPKQTRLVVGEGGELQLGNWINLPYFACRNSDRYAMGGDGPTDFESFLQIAEFRRQSREDLNRLLGVDHSEAPPCFQRMIAERVPDGYRNEALYHATVYLKRAFPEDWRDRAFQFNSESLATPLPMVEAKRTITSAARRDYKYKCSAEPCKSLCDRTKCLTRKFGITPSYVNSDAGAPQMPEVTAVQKYITDPPRYEIVADGVTIALTADEFLRYPLMRYRLMEALNRPMPEVPTPVFEQQLMPKYMELVEIMSVPEEASPAGLMRTRLLDWLRKSVKVATTAAERQSVLLNLPVKCELDERQVYIFKGPAFVDHLRRIRAEDLRGPPLYHALRALGLEYKNVRILKRPYSLWVVPAELVEDNPLEPRDFVTEF